MKMPKAPKPRKMPKKPKHSASAATWENYDKRANAVKQHNAHAQSEWKKKCAKVHSDAKKKEALIRKYSR